MKLFRGIFIYRCSPNIIGSSETGHNKGESVGKLDKNPNIRANNLRDVLEHQVSVEKQIDRSKVEHTLLLIIKAVLFSGLPDLALRGHRHLDQINLNEKPRDNEGNFRE